MIKFFLTTVTLFFLAGSAIASDNDTLRTDSVITVDTVLYMPGNVLLDYTDSRDSSNFENRLIQNPTKALFKSMIVPGWGQLGNKRKFKTALFFGLDVWFIASAIDYGNQTKDYRDLYQATSKDNIALRNSYYDSYLSQKDQRNKYTWFAVIVTFVSMFDAYTDAHLSGFPEKERHGNIGFGFDYANVDRLTVKVSYSF